MRRVTASPLASAGSSAASALGSAVASSLGATVASDAAGAEVAAVVGAVVCGAQAAVTHATRSSNGKILVLKLWIMEGFLQIYQTNLSKKGSHIDIGAYTIA
jgi:hypothetical protein